MKKAALIFTMMIVSMTLAIGQKFKLIDCLDKSKIQKADITAEDSIDEKEEGKILIPLDQFEGKNPEKSYRLINLHNLKETTAPTIEGKDLVFSLGKPLEGVEEKSIYFQLTTTKKKCYNVIIKLNKKSNEPPIAQKPTHVYKPLTLPTSSRPEIKCETCLEKERVIQYNFSNNELRTFWPKGNRLLRQRFWYGLPRVRKEFSFRVINVNPFRYDIKIENELVSLYPDTTPILTQAFTASSVAVAASEDSVSEESDLEKAMKQFKVQLVAKIIELRDAGDCLSPCDTVYAVNRKIITFFQQYGYEEKESLETYLTRELGLNNEPKEDDVKKFAEFNSIIKVYTAFRSTGSGTVYYHIPQTQNVDQYLFTLNVTPKEGVSTGSRVINQPILVDVLGGLRVDASTGLFFTNLLDDKYSLRTDSTLNNGPYVKSKTIIKETGNNRDFGVSSLLHFYPKMTTFVNLAASLGAGVTINDKPKVRYLMGGSLLLGRDNRVSITAGWSFGYVDQLSSKYTYLSSGTTANYSETSVPMQKVFKKSSFFSITYNIPIGRKKEEVKAAESDDKSDSEDKKDDKDDDKKKDGKS